MHENIHDERPNVVSAAKPRWLTAAVLVASGAIFAALIGVIAANVADSDAPHPSEWHDDAIAHADSEAPPSDGDTSHVLLTGAGLHQFGEGLTKAWLSIQADIDHWHDEYVACVSHEMLQSAHCVADLAPMLQAQHDLWRLVAAGVDYLNSVGHNCVALGHVADEFDRAVTEAITRIQPVLARPVPESDASDAAQQWHGDVVEEMYGFVFPEPVARPTVRAAASHCFEGVPSVDVTLLLADERLRQNLTPAA